MSLFAIGLILFGVDRPAPVQRAPTAPVVRGWPYRD